MYLTFSNLYQIFNNNLEGTDSSSILMVFVRLNRAMYVTFVKKNPSKADLCQKIYGGPIVKTVQHGVVTIPKRPLYPVKSYKL